MALPSNSSYDLFSIPAPSADLTNVILVLDLGANMSTDWWAGVDTSDGTKLKVSKGDGTTELAFDVQNFDNTAETGILYIRWSGTLASAGGDQLQVWAPKASYTSYGVTNTFGRNNTWQDYGVVLHLNQDPSGTAPQFPDATGNGHDGTAVNMDSSNQVAGKIGNAISFNGTDERIDLATTYVSPTVSWTSVGWVNSPNILSEWGDASGDNRVVFNPSSDRTFMEKATNINFHNYAETIAVDTWYRHNDTHLSNGGINGYLSTLSSSDNVESSLENSLSVDYIGYNGVNGYGEGILQELWIAEFEYSKYRHDLEYANQDDPSSFWGVGTWQGSTGDKTITLTDSVGVADSTGSANVDFTISDSVTVTDGSGFDISLLLADSVSVSDSTQNANVSFTLQDNISISDSVSISKDVFIQLADSIGVSDSISTLANLISISDSVSLADALNSIDVDLSLSDSVSVSDVLASLDNAIVLTDAITVNDSAADLIIIGQATEADLSVKELYKIELEAKELYIITLTPDEKIG